MCYCMLLTYDDDDDLLYTNMLLDIDIFIYTLLRINVKHQTGIKLNYRDTQVSRVYIEIPYSECGLGQTFFR